MTELCTSDREEGLEELKSFHSSFHPFFRVNTRDVIKPALQYQQGLLFGEKSKNMTNMEMTVPDCDHQSLQNFISDSKWDEEGVIGEIQRRVSALIGNAVHGSVHLDESGYMKGGEHSVGVKRQYCGLIGKVDNCQMGVFLGYALWNYRTLINHGGTFSCGILKGKSSGAICCVYVSIMFEMSFLAENRGSLSEETITGR